VSGAPEPRPPGRPRDPAADAKILGAALALALEGGLAGLTMEGIAARAGVGKATVYRRWTTKEALLADALRELAPGVEVPDTGSARGDYLALMRGSSERFDRRATVIVARLLTEAAEEPELFTALRAAVVDPRRAALRAILERGAERGEVRADADLELAVDALAGPVMYRAMVDGAHYADVAAAGHPEALWDLVAGGLAPR
jgi:AcrR family transcriptional regulator